MTNWLYVLGAVLLIAAERMAFGVEDIFIKAYNIWLRECQEQVLEHLHKVVAARKLEIVNKSKNRQMFEAAQFEKSRRDS
jgi:hypothetical protein